MPREPFELLMGTKEPIFANGEQRRGKYVVYLDSDGAMACCNFKPHANLRLCSVCGNHCVMFVVDERGDYTCSACGKFPPELLQRLPS